MKGIVRIPQSDGYCFLEYISENETKVTYQLHTNPGGDIVAWLANQTIVDMAFGTLAALKKLVE